MADRPGQVWEGFRTELLVVCGDPRSGLTVRRDQGAPIPMILKGGPAAKDGLAACALDAPPPRASIVRDTRRTAPA